MKRERLTPDRIRRFICPTEAKQAFLWDAVAPRLAVRATVAAKSFIFEAKLNRATIRITIGDVNVWTVEAARAESNRLQSLVDQGIDPRQEKQERIAASETKRAVARRQCVTVAEAWDVYIEARRHKWSARTLFDHEKIARAGGEAKKRGPGTIEPGPLATLMPEKLDSLTPELVAGWLKAETARRPTRAALAYRLLRAFIRWAAGMPEYQATAHVEAVGSRVARDNLQRVRAKEGDSLQREQLATWFQAVRELGNPVQSAYLQALLLTGTRREELAGLRWADVDFQWKSLSIADKVEEAGRVIPLTPYVAALLATLPRRNEWVFSSTTAAGGRIQEPRPAHTRALAVAGLPHVSLHGLRRSFGTLAEWTETPVGIVAQIMGHKPSAIAEKHYRRRPLDLLRMWHVKLEAWILEQAGIEQPKEEQAGLRLVKA